MEHLAESRLDVELHRPVGGEVAGATDTAAGAVLDFDTDDDDEPRTIVFLGFGPRWATVPDVLAPALPEENN